MSNISSQLAERALRHSKDREHHTPCEDRPSSAVIVECPRYQNCSSLANKDTGNGPEKKCGLFSTECSKRTLRCSVHMCLGV